MTPQKRLRLQAKRTARTAHPLAIGLALILACSGAWGYEPHRVSPKNSLNHPQKKHYEEEWFSFAALREWDYSLFLGNQKSSEESVRGFWTKTIRVRSNGATHEVLRFNQEGWAPHVRVLRDEHKNIRHLDDRTIRGERARYTFEYDRARRLKSLVVASEGGSEERRVLHRKGGRVARVESYDHRGRLKHTDQYYDLDGTTIVIRMGLYGQLLLVRWYRPEGEVVFVKQNQYALGSARFTSDGDLEPAHEAVTTEDILSKDYDSYEAGLERVVYYKASGLHVYEHANNSSAFLLYEGAFLKRRITPLRVEPLNKSMVLASLLGEALAWADHEVTVFEPASPSIKKHFIMVGKRIVRSSLWSGDAELLTRRYTHYKNGSVKGVAVYRNGTLVKESLFPMRLDESSRSP